MIPRTNVLLCCYLTFNSTARIYSKRSLINCCFCCFSTSTAASLCILCTPLPPNAIEQHSPSAPWESMIMALFDQLESAPTQCRQTSTLLSVASEIRNNIYGYVFEGASILHQRANLPCRRCARYHGWNHGRKRWHLLITCKQTLNEGLPIYYEELKFIDTSLCIRDSECMRTLLRQRITRIMIKGRQVDDAAEFLAYRFPSLRYLCLPSLVLGWATGFDQLGAFDNFRVSDEYVLKQLAKRGKWHFDCGFAVQKLRPDLDIEFKASTYASYKCLPPLARPMYVRCWQIYAINFKTGTTCRWLFKKRVTINQGPAYLQASEDAQHMTKKMYEECTQAGRELQTVWAKGDYDPWRSSECPLERWGGL